MSNLFNTGKLLATQADVDKLTKEEAAKFKVVRTKDRKATDKPKHEAGVPDNAPVKSIPTKEETKVAAPTKEATPVKSEKK